MDVLESGHTQQEVARRCHVWSWSDDPGPIECEKRTLVVGGLSFIGLIAAASTAAISANGNRRRRAAATAAAGPRWRYAATGVGQVVDNHLLIRDRQGCVLTFDLGSSQQLESPQSGWLRFQAPDSRTWWAVEVK